MTTTTTRARWAAAAAALLLAPALLTACSSGGADSTPTPKADTASKFAACMRDKGYDVPDSAGDEMSLSVPDGVDPDQYQEDSASCAGSSGTGGGAGDAGGAKPVDRDGSAWKKTVACVRDQGFADFPDDPDAAGSYKPADEAAYDQALDSCVGGSSSTGSK